MFAEPTINDFQDNIRWHLDRALTDAVKALTRVKAEAVKTQALHSSRAVILTIEAVKKEFDVGIEKALGELRRTIRTTKLDRDELRQATMQCLMNFAESAKAITGADQFRTMVRAGEIDKRLGARAEIDKRLELFDQDLQFMMRQFDVGLFNPQEPEVPQASNAININKMIGGAIQQGSPHATQIAEINVSAARAALAKFEAALPQETKSQAMPDIQTIRAQLSKPKPSHVIIQEAGKSLRNIVEGIGAGLMAPALATAALALWSALGLG